MSATSTPQNLDNNLLLDNFSQADYEMAQNNLMQRFDLWNGILVAKDKSAIITPDDLTGLRAQASALIDKKDRSHLEMEQLKIMTLLIYLLINADKSLTQKLMAGGATLNLDEVQTPFKKSYILNKVLLYSSQLAFADIKTFVHYQNQYTSGIKHDLTDIESLPVLHSKEQTYFKLRNIDGALVVTEADAPAASVQAESVKPAPVEEPAKPVQSEPTRPRPKGQRRQPDVAVADKLPDAVEPLEDKIPVVVDQRDYVITGTGSKKLFESFETTQFECGSIVAAACYIGVKRERNEDGVVVMPYLNQCTVIDAMGGYGNGIIARDTFINGLISNNGDIDNTVSWSQEEYDRIGLRQGGVCLINLKIVQKGDNFIVICSQAGDVHMVVFDDDGHLRYETVDEAIGHRVINAVVSQTATGFQRANGWDQFGVLTRTNIKAKRGWRIAFYSDGIANHYDAHAMGDFLYNASPEKAIRLISDEVHEAMQRDGAYYDNCSIAIVDI